MQLPHNHLFLTVTHDIADISRPLRQLGIINFTYMRTDADGSRIYLDDTPDTLDLYLQGKYSLDGNIECPPHFYKEQAVLWSTVSNQKPLDDCLRSRGIDHGIFMFEPQENSSEMFCFAAKSGNHGIVNTYLSNMEFLHKFKQHFREKAASIIKEAEKQKIILPFNNEKMNFTNDIGRLTNQDYALREILSERQLECCALLVIGHTAKEIAKILGLSPRTVECYIAEIRAKLKCRNKSELIARLSKFHA